MYMCLHMYLLYIESTLHVQCLVLRTCKYTYIRMYIIYCTSITSLHDYFVLLYRYANDKTFMSWQLLHGRAFVFARTDWEYVLNTFAFGYAIGYHFIASKEGSCNGNFLGIGKKY